MENKYFLGGVLGAVIPAGINLVTGLIGRNRARKEEERVAMESEQRQMQDYSKAVLDYYPTQGYGSTALYRRYGGRVPGYGKVTGGSFRHIQNGVGEFVGKSHEAGGIKLSKGGKVYAEVEGGELFKDGKVLSDKIPYEGGSFASRGRGIAKSAEYKSIADRRRTAMSKLYDIRSGFASKNTARRVLATNPDPIDELYNEQEQYKGQMQQEEFKYGGKLPKANFGAFLPNLIDNATNAVLTATTPKVPKPVYTKAPTLNTTYQDDAQRAAITRNRNLGMNTILQNSSNSPMARKAATVTAATALQQGNEVADRKFNIENQLENQQSMINYKNRLNNNQLTNQYNQQKLERNLDIQARISENAQNLSNDILMNRREKNIMNLENKKLALTMMKYQGTGVLDRKNSMQIMGLIDAGLSPEEAFRALEERKKVKGWNTDMINPINFGSRYNANSHLRHNAGF